MERTADFQRNALDCRRLAAKMPPAQREHLLDMAGQWEELAAEAPMKGREDLASLADWHRAPQ